MIDKMEMTHKVGELQHAFFATNRVIGNFNALNFKKEKEGDNQIK